VSTAAQSPQENTAAQEREFKNTIPEHVPIKVKVRNEQSFKKLDNKNWARELEIEVKNTGSKPIYYLYVIVFMPDVVLDNGYPLGIQIHYGRTALVHLDAPIQPEDVPILPGEIVTLKIPEGKVRGYEEARRRENRSDPKRVEFELQRINFGDGTGLRGTGGRTDSVRKQSQNVPRPKREPAACQPAPRVRETDSPGVFFKAFSPSMPASFLRVKFSLPSEPSTSVLAVPVQSSFCGCKNTSDCM
jgi:hypothetical protein